jgi:hypothetical protein
MRAHSEDSALEIVARLIESRDRKQETPYDEHVGTAKDKSPRRNGVNKSAKAVLVTLRAGEE